MLVQNKSGNLFKAFRSTVENDNATEKKGDRAYYTIVFSKTLNIVYYYPINKENGEKFNHKKKKKKIRTPSLVKL